MYPNEDIPFWVLSNHFYKEMTPFLRWGLFPFLLLFTVSAVVFGLRAIERLFGWHTCLFDIDLQPILGFPGRLIDLVQFVNSAVIATLLILAVPLYFLLRDTRAAIVRYGIARARRLHLEKDAQYIAAARRIFAADPSVVLFVYGHTHIPSLREVDGRYVINTGTWLKRLEYVPVRVGRLPGVYVPSYQLNYFELTEDDGDICVRYRDPSQGPAERSHVARAASHPGPAQGAASRPSPRRRGWARVRRASARRARRSESSRARELVHDSSSPDLRLVEPERRQLTGPQRRIAREQELVELRRRDAGAREHGVRLAAVVDLVHEEMRQRAVDTLAEMHAAAAIEHDLGAPGVRGRARRRSRPGARRWRAAPSRSSAHVVHGVTASSISGLARMPCSASR